MFAGQIVLGSIFQKRLRHTGDQFWPPLPKSIRRHWQVRRRALTYDKRSCLHYLSFFLLIHQFHPCCDHHLHHVVSSTHGTTLRGLTASLQAICETITGHSRIPQFTTSIQTTIESSTIDRFCIHKVEADLSKCLQAQLSATIGQPTCSR